MPAPPGPQAIRHPWRTAGIFASLDFIGILFMSATHGVLDARALLLAVGSAIAVFVLVSLLLFGYHVVAGDE